HKLVQLLTTT
nr:Chain B, Decamer from Nuclear receptor coactivator 1 [synthetic construct]2NV7_C Chain C, Nuclear receptor coactivator 1 [synthetic construct]2NV7_D Chain D, Nuclear receptor coactivator 1 [synthetic construct]